MRNNRLLGLVVLILLLGVVSACGVVDNPDEEHTPTVSAPTSLSQSDADIDSGCWKATDRVNTEGDPELANTQQWSSPPAMTIDGSKKYSALVETSMGNFTIQLLPAEAPQTVNNFVCLARAGFFDNTVFHRIVAGFVIQGGDPTGTGRGGPGYKFADEPISLDYEKGTVAMANAGPNTNGSQFFVVLDDLRGKLGKNYTIFGKISEGQDVVDAIGAVQTRAGSSGEKSSPVEPVTIEKVTISES